MHIHSIQQLVLSCPKDELLDIPSTFYTQAVCPYTKTSMGTGSMGGRLGLEGGWEESRWWFGRVITTLDICFNELATQQ